MKLEKLNQSYYVIADNNKEIGSFQLDSNGYYYFWENSELTGCWEAHSLRKIADLLDEVNKPYNDSVNKYFEQEQLMQSLREKTSNFITHFDTSTLMVGDNYSSGQVTVEGVTYYIVKYKEKVRVWDTPQNYMAWVNGRKDYILKFNI